MDITGSIISTGNGRIVCADGPADISIDAKGVTGADLYVGRIANNDREGLIRIHNTDSKTVEELKTNAYRRASDFKISVAEWTLEDWKKHQKYKPEKLCTLQWTGGTSGQTVKDMSYKKYYASFFGLFKLWSTESTQTIIDNIGSDFTNVQTTTRAIANGTMERGVVITPLLKSWDQAEINAIDKFNSNAGNGIVIKSQVHNNGAATTGKVNASEMTYTNWTHTKGYVTYSWTVTQGNSTSSSSYISAQYPISREFSQAKSDGAINIRSGGNVFFQGNIESAANLREGVTDKSAISVTAKGEVKTLGEARLLTDSLTVTGKSVDVQHGAVGAKAVIDLTAQGGDIVLASDKGDIAIKNVVIKNAPDNGKISITGIFGFATKCIITFIYCVQHINEIVACYK